MTSVLRHHLHIETKIFVSFTLFATLLLFIISPDSYTHDLYGRHDSAWFFMCGKAWMEGLTPYVDFADSKGPLLWLIYGLGYLISPTNYIGVFWLSCVWYALIFYITYLTARIFLPGRRNALICTLLMALAYFNPMFHYETRAEDWCMLFMIASLYVTCKILFTNHMSESGIRWSFFILGVSFASPLLIKYSISAMQSIFILFAVFHTLRRHTIIAALLCLVLGLFVVVFPFILYTFYKGCLSAFVLEYFIKSFLTVSYEGDFLENYLFDWSKIFHDSFKFSFLVFLLFGSIMACFKLLRYKLFPLVSTMFIFSITIYHAHWDYYFNSCAICCIWTFIWVLKAISSTTLRPFATALGVVAVLTLCQLFIDRYFKHNLFWNNGPERAEFYTGEYYISQKSSPFIINASFHEEGHGILSRALPGTKYWAKQNGSTMEMDIDHIRGILSHKADFIIKFDSINALIDEPHLRASGYSHRYADYVFSETELREPTTPIHVSNWEVLSKTMPKALRK